MGEENTAAGGGERAGQARDSGGRWLAVLALLIALAAVCGIAYLYYTLVMHNPAAGIAERQAGLQAAQSRLGNDLQRLAGERQAAYVALRAELEERQRASEQALAESLGGLTAPDIAPQREWKLAEVEFLLRAANHSALLERDAESALGLLRSADAILGGLDGPVGLRVRTAIASEVLSLEQTDAADPSAIYLRLDAIKRRLAELTLALPEYASTIPESAPAPEDEMAGPPIDDAGEAAPDLEIAALRQPPAEDAFRNTGEGTAGVRTADVGTTGVGTTIDDAAMPGEPAASRESGFFATVGRELGGLVRFRRFDTSLERPPAPTESDLLAVNLRLMLEQAQLAALKRDQAVYSASLDAALDWSRALLDGRHDRVQETIDALEALRRLNLEAPLPDISGSLNQLLEARRERP